MATVTRDDVEQLVVASVADVVGAAPGGLRPDARFREDLHADSLDLVEIIETVEARLRARGVRVTVAEERLRALLTVGDAVDELRRLIGGEAAS